MCLTRFLHFIELRNFELVIFDDSPVMDAGFHIRKQPAIHCPVNIAGRPFPFPRKGESQILLIIVVLSRQIGALRKYGFRKLFAAVSRKKRWPCRAGDPVSRLCNGTSKRKVCGTSLSPSCFSCAVGMRSYLFNLDERLEKWLQQKVCKFLAPDSSRSAVRSLSIVLDRRVARVATFGCSICCGRIFNNFNKKTERIIIQRFRMDKKNNGASRSFSRSLVD
jgi:hypothetical protein